jgi:hypothetical protein
VTGVPAVRHDDNIEGANMPAVARTFSVHPLPSRLFTPVALATALLLSACGDGGVASGSSSTSATTFPTGLSVGVPSEINNSTTVAAAPAWDGLRFAGDLGRTAWTALLQGDTRTMGRLATALMPMGHARAAVSQPDLKAQAIVIDKVLSGDSGITLAALLDMGDLFRKGGNATCYGPSMLYSNHDDGGGVASGTLPGGDLGLWTATEGVTGVPCVAAQLAARVNGVKERTKQGLMLMAVMRRTVAANSLSMPLAGNSVNLQSALQTTLSAVPAFSAVTVDAATIALDGPGTTYTYRMVLSTGSGTTARSGEVIMRHTPGSSASAYSGILQVAGFMLDSDVAFGCSDLTSSGMYQVAQVSTLKYSRSGSTVEFGSRDGAYCGSFASTASTNYGADVASFTVDGQLDPAVKITAGGMPPARGATLGWRGDFNRFAGAYDKDTVAGNFLFAWQAGTGDSHSRVLAANADYNTVTEDRTIEGYFGFADEISTTSGALLGMICNWAGPGNSHTPSSRFQSQTATLTSSASSYVLAFPSDSKITYAPTNNCNSTTTAFDVNVDNAIASGEGVGTVVDLDTPSGGNTVQQEIVFRGYSQPGLF